MVKNNSRYFSFGDLIIYILFFFVSHFVGMLISQALFADYGDENMGKLAYIPAFSILVLISTVYRRVRCSLTQSPCRFVGGGRYSANCVLFGIVMMFAISIATDPLIAMFPNYIAEYVESFTSGDMWVTLIVTIIFAPILEEIFFRAILLKDMSVSWGPRIGIIISASIFAILHFNVIQVVPAFLMGLVMGYIYMYTRRGLSTVIVLHIINNLIASTSLFWGFGVNSIWQRYLPDGVFGIIIYSSSVALILFVILRILLFNNGNNNKIIKKITLTDKI